ncbi:hypothetical protein [Streptomyces lanatus]|uniref:Uncharacterized protein n=1 Tax=Streptomyces lanatus TaxID=66900 RepID=A0ABV1XLS3_9ACTN|nr:hypothetical protein [Streptomyces lanatus]GHG98658.1 hypothetical protein GCM10018780_24580 [Streptomyces lanatus]
MNNVSNIEIGANYKLAPVDSVIADSVVTGSQGRSIRCSPPTDRCAGSVREARRSTPAPVTTPS